VACSPTEVLTAWGAGAQVIKVFPADIGGPAYLKTLHGPLPQVRLLPTGGVNLKTIADFLDAGAGAVGPGGALVEPKAVQTGDMARIKSLAQQYVEAVKQTRAAMSMSLPHRPGRRRLSAGLESDRTSPADQPCLMQDRDR